MTRGRFAAAAALALAGAFATAGTAAAAPGPQTLVVQTVPALAHVPVTVDGATATTGADGTARFTVSSLQGAAASVSVPETTIAPGLRVRFDRVLGTPASGRPLQVGLDTQRRVSWSFEDRHNRPVDPSSLDFMRLRSGAGQEITLRGSALGQPRWLPASRIAHGVTGLVSKDLYYGIDKVSVDGGDLVFRSQQRFYPTRTQHWTIRLSYFSLRVTSRDWLFGSATGHELQVTRPDGHLLSLPIGTSGVVTLGMLPRGAYQLTVPGAALKFSHPVALSRDTVVELRVVTKADVALLGALGLLGAVAVIVGGAWWRRRAAAKRQRRSTTFPSAGPSAPSSTAKRVSTLRSIAVVAVLAATGVVSPHAHAATPTAATSNPPVPAFAYYYIWFDPSSWNHAKVDYPSLGRYSSDDVAVMRAHVQEAKSAGLSGFLVSWKERPKLDRRLANLVKVADAQQFHLGIVYEGLDVRRDPLPVATVEHDLTWFADHYAHEPAFRIYGKPLVIWTGTWRFTTAEIAQVTSAVRSRLLVLASARQVQDYERIRSDVDGNAYYWSSGNPEKAWYAQKLATMGRVVHASGGLWIAPAAAGFDARKLGGHIVIDRQAGQTLEKTWAAALASSPDAIGVISWNEFSENSYVEPSVHYGTTALATVAKLTGSALHVVDNPDSSESGGAGSSGLHPRTALWVIVALVIGGVIALPLIRRRRPFDDAKAGTP